MRKSKIAESIMIEYERKKRYEAKIQRKELAKFISEKCSKCQNKVSETIPAIGHAFTTTTVSATCTTDGKITTTDFIELEI